MTKRFIIIYSLCFLLFSFTVLGLVATFCFHPSIPLDMKVGAAIGSWVVVGIIYVIRHFQRKGIVR
jgi:hypothetical protein